MQPFLCPSCTKILKSLYAPPQIPLTLSHQCPLLLPLVDWSNGWKRLFFYKKKRKKGRGKLKNS